jgi:hypothetical protein
VKGPNREIIRGKVSIFRGGAGGLSYFSSGSVRERLCGGVWAEAAASASREIRQTKKLAFETLERLNTGVAFFI